jgi:hypothetical protein
MKTITTLFIAVTILLQSCKKEIMIDLKDEDVKFVIEGGIANNNKPAEITITKTTAFSNSNTFPPVSGADVILSDDSGNSEPLTEVTSGKYIGSSITGVPGRTYSLKITADNKTFSARCKMPEVVKLDTVVGKQEVFMGTVFYNVYPVFKDPAGKKNRYRFIHYINNKRNPGSIVTDDEFTDGNYNIQPLSLDINSVRDGDIVDIEMHTIDAPIYKYFESMAHTNMGSAAPSNPVSNIQGDALGYFSAHTVQNKILVVKKQ